MPKVQLLTSLGCTPCLRVKHVLKELQVTMPNLVVEELDYGSPAGSKLALENSVLYPPAVFLEGKLVAKGKIDTNKMVTIIHEANGENA